MAVASSKKKAPPSVGDWKAFSAWVTTLSEDQALKALLTEAGSDKPRSYVMKRLYHRWRSTSARSDLAAIELGKLPKYLAKLAG